VKLTLDLWVWMTVLPDERMNIVGTVIPDLGEAPTPLVFASERSARLAQFLAEAHRRGSGQRVFLVHFAEGQIVEELGGDS
jgi:hypothetical protein